MSVPASHALTATGAASFLASERFRSLSSGALQNALPASIRVAFSLTNFSAAGWFFACDPTGCHGARRFDATRCRGLTNCATTNCNTTNCDTTGCRKRCSCASASCARATQCIDFRHGLKDIRRDLASVERRAAGWCERSRPFGQVPLKQGGFTC